MNPNCFGGIQDPAFYWLFHSPIVLLPDAPTSADSGPLVAFLVLSSAAEVQAWLASARSSVFAWG